MKVYVYRTTDQYGHVVREGALTHMEDLFIEELTGLDTTSDRDIWDVQEFIDRHAPDSGLQFEFDTIEVTPKWEKK